MNDDDLEQLEEEFRRKIELEEEEKKLEETLEFQRRIENEAKQRHLAEQQKRSSGFYLEVEEDLQDFQTKAVTDSLDSYKHVRETMQIGISLFSFSCSCRETEFAMVINLAVTWFLLGLHGYQE